MNDDIKTPQPTADAVVSFCYKCPTIVAVRKCRQKSCKHFICAGCQDETGRTCARCKPLVTEAFERRRKPGLRAGICFIVVLLLGLTVAIPCILSGWPEESPVAGVFLFTIVTWFAATASLIACLYVNYGDLEEELEGRRL